MRPSPADPPQTAARRLQAGKQTSLFFWPSFFFRESRHPPEFRSRRERRSVTLSEVERSLGALYHMAAAAAARLVRRRLSAGFTAVRPSRVPRCSRGESGLPPSGLLPAARAGRAGRAASPPAADQCQQPYGRRLVGITISAAGISLGGRTASATPQRLYIFPLFLSLHFLPHLLIFLAWHRIIW